MITIQIGLAILKSKEGLLKPSPTLRVAAAIVLISASDASGQSLDSPSIDEATAFARGASPPQLAKVFIGLMPILVGPMGTMYEALRTMDRRPAISLTHVFNNEDGTSRSVNITSFADLETFITAQRRLHVALIQEIRNRGYEKLPKAFKLASSPECSGNFLATGDATVTLNEFLFRLTQQNKHFDGIVVQNSIVLMSEAGFAAQPLVGAIKDGQGSLQNPANKCLVTLSPP